LHKVEKAHLSLTNLKLGEHLLDPGVDGMVTLNIKEIYVDWIKLAMNRIQWRGFREDNEIFSFIKIRNSLDQLKHYRLYFYRKHYTE
jgi:hypothetical protein